MSLTMGEKIRILMRRKHMNLGQLAEATGQTRANLGNKLSRDNFKEQDLRKIAEALNCDFDAAFVMRDTGERV